MQGFSSYISLLEGLNLSSNEMHIVLMSGRGAMTNATHFDDIRQFMESHSNVRSLLGFDASPLEPKFLGTRLSEYLVKLATQRLPPQAALEATLVPSEELFTHTSAILFHRPATKSRVFYETGSPQEKDTLSIHRYSMHRAPCSPWGITLKNCPQNTNCQGSVSISGVEMVHDVPPSLDSVQIKCKSCKKTGTVLRPTTLQRCKWNPYFFYTPYDPRLPLEKAIGATWVTVAVADEEISG